MVIQSLLFPHDLLAAIYNHQPPRQLLAIRRHGVYDSYRVSDLTPAGGFQPIIGHNTVRRRMQGHQYRSERCQAHDCEEGQVDNRLGVMLLGTLTVTDLTSLGGKNGNAGQKPFQKSKDRRQHQATKH